MTLGHNKDIGRIVTQLLASSEIDAQTEARRIVDHLTILGFEDYRAILSVEQPPKPEHDGWIEAEESPGRPLAMK